MCCRPCVSLQVLCVVGPGNGRDVRSRPPTDDLPQLRQVPGESGRLQQCHTQVSPHRHVLSVGSRVTTAAVTVTGVTISCQFVGVISYFDVIFSSCLLQDKFGSCVHRCIHVEGPVLPALCTEACLSVAAMRSQTPTGLRCHGCWWTTRPHWRATS